MKKKSLVVVMAILVLSLVACAKSGLADMSDKDLYKTYIGMSESEREDFRKNLTEEDIYRLESVIVTNKLAEDLDVNPKDIADMVANGEVSIGMAAAVESEEVADAKDTEVVTEEQTVEVAEPTSDVAKDDKGDVVGDVLGTVVEGVEQASREYEPLPEILNAEIYEDIYQIDNLIVRYDRNYTIEEMLNQFPEDEYNIYDSSKDEINLDRLMPDGTTEWYSIEKNGTVVFSILAANYYGTGETIELRDCQAYRFYINQYCSRDDDLYVYLAKGMRYNENTLYTDDRLTFGNIEEYLQELGYEKSDIDAQDVETQDVERGSFYYKDSTGLRYTIYGYDVDNNYTEYSWGRTCNDMLMVTFSIDTDTRYVSSCYTFNTISYIK